MRVEIKHRSKVVTEGVARAPPHRSLFKAAGFSDEDLAKPLIAIANSWNEIVPGHIHLNELAIHVRAGVKEGGEALLWSSILLR